MIFCTNFCIRRVIKLGDKKVKRLIVLDGLSMFFSPSSDSETLWPVLLVSIQLELDCT
jgi:hypothetical protein